MEPLPMQKLADSLIDITYYPVPSGEPRGAVIVCPGGGYVGLAAHEAEPIARWVNGAGMPAFVLRYRVAPHRHPAPLQDAARAVRLVRSQAQALRVRPDKIAILGFSAGGHLVTTLATHFDGGDPRSADPVERASCRPDAIVACYPVVSLVSLGHRGSTSNLLGEAPSEAVLRDLSNELQVTPQSPPAFLWHTADDPVVPVQQSLLYAEALALHGVPYELHVFPHGPHGLGLSDGTSFVGASPQVAQWTRLCEVWLQSLGF
jgi:acetyl esterase/lipase